LSSFHWDGLEPTIEAPIVVSLTGPRGSDGEVFELAVEGWSAALAREQGQWEAVIVTVP